MTKSAKPTTVNSEEKDGHILLKKDDVRPIQSLQELRKLFKETGHLEILMKLLDIGFDVPLGTTEDGKPECEEDVISFYLSVANGWNDVSLFEKPAGNEFLPYPHVCVGFDQRGNKILKAQPQILRMVAQKAAEVLAVRFFKNLAEVEVNSIDKEWAKLVFGSAFPALLKFFEIKKSDKGVKITNLPQVDQLSAKEEPVIAFIIKLAIFLISWCPSSEEAWEESWYNKEGADEGEKERRTALVDSSRLWIIEILDKLNRLDVLEDHVLAIPPTCAEKIQEIALRTEGEEYMPPTYQKKRAESVEEAVFMGSRAARLYLHYKIAKSEHERFMAIKKAEDAAAEAINRVKELKKKKS